MAKQPSLAAAGGALTADFKLPTVFGAPVPMKPRFIAPYITFAHNKRADEFKRIVDKFGIPDEGTMFLVTPDNIVKLDTAKVGWIHHQQLWTSNDTTGKVIGTAFKEMPKPWKEVVEAVVLLYLEDRIIPANIQFRTTKCPAALALSKALAECQTPEWPAKSEAHKATLATVVPAFRFYGDVTLAPARTGGEGNTYRPTQCTVKPTTPAEWGLLKAFTEDLASQKALEDAAVRYQSQLDFFKSKELK